MMHGGERLCQIVGMSLSLVLNHKAYSPYQSKHLVDDGYLGLVRLHASLDDEVQVSGVETFCRLAGCVLRIG